MDRSSAGAVAVLACLGAALVATLELRRQRARAGDSVDARMMRSVSDEQTFFGLDIGGTLSKIAFFCRGSATDGPSSERLRKVLGYIEAKDRYGETGRHDRYLSVHSPAIGGSLHFIHFETRHVTNALRTIEEAELGSCIDVVGGTGGGAHLYESLIRNSLGVALHKVDEMSALIRGITFLLTHVADAAFALEDADERPRTAADQWVFDLSRATRTAVAPVHEPAALFPFVLVNIGSGVSVLRVDSPARYTRISGTALGGATFLGLCKALTGVTSFDEALALAANGDATAVNMTVGDIYGGDYVGEGFVLPAALTASCFGKMVRSDRAVGEYRREDVALALLLMIAQNVAHVGYQSALRAGVNRIYFAGTFLRCDRAVARPIVMHALSFFVNTWSGGAVSSCFLKHDGYCGSMGALLETLDWQPRL